MWAVKDENSEHISSHLRSMATRLLERDVGKDVVLSQVHSSEHKGYDPA